MAAGRGEARHGGLGGSVGTARHVEQSRRLEEVYGIPNLAGFVPLVALTTVLPDDGVDATFNLSVARTF